MAIDLGSGNTARYHSVPDSSEFTLPDGDWALLALVYPQDSAAIKYIFSTGTFGSANTVNLYTYDNVTGGTGCKLAAATEAFVPTALTMDKWAWMYATRRGSNLYAGQIQVGASSVTESAAIAVSGSQDSATAPNIGRRTDGTANRHWKGRWGQVAFLSGKSVSADDMVALANGASVLPLLSSNIKFLAHGRSANDAVFGDLISGHALTRQGTSYGANEEDIQTPYVWTPGYTAGVASAASADGAGLSSGIATVSGVGASTAESSASSSGVATVSGVSASVAESSASSGGIASASGVGASVSEAVGSSDGVATASGVGASSTGGSSGSAAGAATVSGISESSAESTGTAAGVVSASGVSASDASGVGASAGVATVSGVGDSVIAGATVGTASGSSTASGVGASVAEASGSSSGEAVVSGVSPSAVVDAGEFSGGYLYISREEREERRRKERVALGLIQDLIHKEHKEQIGSRASLHAAIERFDPILPITPKKLIPARQRKKLEQLAAQEALNVELKKLIQLELEREEEIILRMLMEL